MKKMSLPASYFADGWGVFDIGCLLRDPKDAVLRIVRFSGDSEMDETDGTCHETVNVHFCDGSELDFEDLDRLVFVKRTWTPIAPDWFVDAVTEERDASDQAESRRKQQAAATSRTQKLHALATAGIPSRPVDVYTDSEIIAKIAGAPVSVAEEVLCVYDSNLQHLAGTSAKWLQRVKGIGEVRAEKIIAAFELGKRLARFHAEKPKITSPADVAGLMMSKMRYLQKEIVCVLCLDTKGGVTTTGKAGEIAGDLKWGKLLAEETVFEGTLNASVFHPREIFRFAIEASANSIVLVHNHPSGDPQPSQEDIRSTKQLIEAGDRIGIKVLDHIVIGDGIFLSLKEENLI